MNTCLPPALSEVNLTLHLDEMSPGKCTGEKRNRRRRGKRQSQRLKNSLRKNVTHDQKQEQDFKVKALCPDASPFIFTFELSAQCLDLREKFEEWPAGGILGFLTRTFGQKNPVSIDNDLEEKEITTWKNNLKSQGSQDVKIEANVGQPRSESCEDTATLSSREEPPPVVNSDTDCIPSPCEQIVKLTENSCSAELPDRESNTIDTPCSVKEQETVAESLKEGREGTISASSPSIPSKNGLHLSDLPAEILCVILENLFNSYADQKHYMNLGYTISIISLVYAPWITLVDRLLHAMDLRIEPGNTRWKTMLVRRRRQLKGQNGNSGSKEKTTSESEKSDHSVRGNKREHSR